MRILQLIDSLEIGGAEKMAVNYANALSTRIAFSALVATRKEGVLKNQIHNNVDYLFLNRKWTIDFGAVFRLKKYCENNEITHIQAHSSSFFTAFLVKLLCPNIKIIWHDHNGFSEFLGKRKSIALKITSFYFDGIVVVNYQLKKWAENTLYCKKVLYLANFTTLNSDENKDTFLKGIDGKRILCLANLRIQKNHFLLIEVAKKLQKLHPEWSFHLIGKDFLDDYSDKIKDIIAVENLSKSVFIYGSKQDTQNCITQAAICVLTSQSEGLPVALLEYGLNKKAVVTTDVGEIPFIIKNNENGFIVSKFDPSNFCLSLIKLIEDDNLRIKMGQKLFETVQKNNSEIAVLETYLNWLKEN